MKDEISKRRGVPYSLSRNEERANKKRTQKARRQAGKKICEKQFDSGE